MTSTSVIESLVDPLASGDLKPLYVESLSLVERLHRRLLDVISDEFDRIELPHLTGTQALLLYNIGAPETGAAELKERCHYLGSAVSYHLRKLAEMGYVRLHRSMLDRRSVRISLTEKGREIGHVVNRLYERHLRHIEETGGIASDDFDIIRRSLGRLDRFLTDQIAYRL